MHVIAESGAWARHDLDVDYDKIIGRDDAHELIPKGEIEFVSGNHVSTYAARACGDTWVYLGPIRKQKQRGACDAYRHGDREARGRAQA